MWTIIFIILTLTIFFKFSDEKSGTNFVAAMIFSGLILMLPYNLIEYFKTDSEKTTLTYIIVSVLAVSALIVVLIKKQSNSEQVDLKRQQRLGGRISHFTKRDFVRDFSEVSNFGWVRTSGKHTREEVENTLKVYAAELGANAVIKFSWQSAKETYQAGKGKRGNPYFRSRTVYGGEAVAVLLESHKHSKKDKKSGERNREPAQYSSRNKPDFERYDGKEIVLDGNNIVGRSEWSFDPLKIFLTELARSNYEYTLFFDNNIYRMLKENNFISENETIQACISRIIGIEKDKIVVTPAKVEADSFIIEFAMRRNAAIISNDGYKDFREAYPGLNSDQLINFELIGDVIFAPKLNIKVTGDALVQRSAIVTNSSYFQNDIDKDAQHTKYPPRDKLPSASKNILYDSQQKAFFGTREMLIELTKTAIQELNWEVTEVSQTAGIVYFKTGWTMGSMSGVAGSISIEKKTNGFFELSAKCKHILAPSQIFALNIGREAQKKGAAVINKMVVLADPYTHPE